MLPSSRKLTQCPVLTQMISHLCQDIQYILYTLLLPRELFFSSAHLFFLKLCIYLMFEYLSKLREAIGKPLVGCLFHKTLSKHCFVCLTFPTTATLIQWREFGAGLSVYPTNERQRECLGNLFETVTLIFYIHFCCLVIYYVPLCLWDSEKRKVLRSWTYFDLSAAF